MVAVSGQILNIDDGAGQRRLDHRLDLAYRHRHLIAKPSV
jgi:hypothetical protein